MILTEQELSAALMHHREYMVKHAMRHFRLTEMDAEDLVSEVMELCLMKRQMFDTEKRAGKIKAWLFTILRNTFVNQTRNVHAKFHNRLLSNSIKSENGEDTGYIFDAAVYDPHANPECFICPEAFQAIIGLVDRLPNKVRSVAKLLMEGYDYEEIASELQIRVGTVRSNINRARRSLIINSVSKGYIPKEEINWKFQYFLEEQA